MRAMCEWCGNRFKWNSSVSGGEMLIGAEMFQPGDIFTIRLSDQVEVPAIVRGIDVKRGTMHYTVFHGTSDWNVQRREVVA